MKEIGKRGEIDIKLRDNQVGDGSFHTGLDVLKTH